MFNKDDFNNIDKVNEDTVPDGVVDASDYALILRKTAEHIRDTDYENPESKMVAMMNIINLMHEDEENLNDNNVYGVAIALMYHIQTLLGGMVDEDRKEYFDHLEKEVLPVFDEESQVLPYYDSEGDTDSE
ncbi:hypothetical protein EB001_00275 [bacterium]|nr:hypothetical protein [bacterium]